MPDNRDGDDAPATEVDFELYYEGATQSLNRTRGVFYTFSVIVLVIFTIWLNEYYSVDQYRANMLRAARKDLSDYQQPKGVVQGRFVQGVVPKHGPCAGQAVPSRGLCYDAFYYAQRQHLATPLDTDWPPRDRSVAEILGEYDHKLSVPADRYAADTSFQIPIFGIRLDYDYLGIVSSPILCFLSFVLWLHLMNERACLLAAYQRAECYRSDHDKLLAKALLSRQQLLLSPKTNPVIASVLVASGCLVQSLILWKDFDTRQVGYSLLTHGWMNAILVIEAALLAGLAFAATYNIGLIENVAGIVRGETGLRVDKPVRRFRAILVAVVVVNAPFALEGFLRAHYRGLTDLGGVAPTPTDRFCLEVCGSCLIAGLAVLGVSFLMTRRARSADPAAPDGGSYRLAPSERTLDP